MKYESMRTIGKNVRHVSFNARHSEEGN